MTQLFLACFAAVVAQVPGDAVEVTAAMPSDPLVAGREYRIDLQWRVRDGYTMSDSGISSAILQIDSPASASLVGEVLTDRKALARNEFLHAPFERLLKSAREPIGFTLTREPAKNEWFALNLVAYLSTTGDNDTRLVRKRLLLPLESGAKAGHGSPQMSDWGNGQFLQNGDFAEPFVVQRADGSSLSLNDHLGKKNIVVTTYRAHW